MTVKDLSRNQLDELKQAYAIQLSETEGEEITDSAEIPDEVIFNHYDEVIFTNDDFFCSCGKCDKYE